MKAMKTFGSDSSCQGRRVDKARGTALLIANEAGTRRIHHDAGVRPGDTSSP